jgi:hypothetical protein
VTDLGGRYCPLRFSRRSSERSQYSHAECNCSGKRFGEKLFINLRLLTINLFKLISELTAKGTKDNVKANFQNNQSAQKNKNQRFLKTIVFFFIYNNQL